MVKQNILELEKRKKIYNFVLKYPGLHIREISRKINIPYSTLEYHLKYLEKHDLLIAKLFERYKRYYISNKIGIKNRKILNYLRQSTPRNIILLLLAYVECSQNEISKNLEKDSTTISFFLKKLESMDIIECVSVNNSLIHKEKIPIIISRTKVSNENIYMLKHPEIIYDLLITYKDNLFDNINTNLILDYVNDFLLEGIPKKIQSPKLSADSIAELIFELFPPSFCA